MQSLEQHLEPTFILRHMHDMVKAGSMQKFAVAFMDLSGAYDSVDRELLFRKLLLLGMSEHSVSILRDLYCNTQCVVKCEKGTHTPFAVGVGLRQGCPLSTTLFNLFIHDLHARLLVACPAAGAGRPAPNASPVAPLIPMLVSMLGYADDIALCDSTPSQLQNLIDAFHAYCVEHGLRPVAQW